MTKITFEQRLECIKIAQEVFWSGPKRVTNVFKTARMIELYSSGESTIDDIAMGLSVLDEEDAKERTRRSDQLVTDIDEQIEEQKKALEEKVPESQ